MSGLIIPPGLRKVSVDGTTITGDGTPANPLIATGGGGGVSVQEDVFAPTTLQTVFTLSQTWAGMYAVVYVNGIESIRNIDFTISGTTLTWLDTPYTLTLGDLFVVDYLVSGSGITFQEDVFAPTNLQTVFTLSQVWNGVFAVVYVNGTEYVLSIDFTIIGTMLTWLDVPFTLAVGDRLVVDYDY